MTTRHEPGGVSVYPYPARRGEFVTICYNGLLKNSGADQVYLHSGYGSLWRDDQYLRMQRTNMGWEKTMVVDKSDVMHFCFKDSANNWDNNAGLNWSVTVH
ncbi:MAG: carbohydrate-binding protein [Syntrophomonadaceae bacterium]|nr:carbohydrate-binding protein [Syntrophomonadaceae bacterium]